MVSFPFDRCHSLRWLLEYCQSKRRAYDDASPTPTPDDPAKRAARAEEQFQLEGEGRDGDTRAAARAAVTEFVRLSLPGWTLRGISSQGMALGLITETPYVFSMDADLERQGHRIVVTFDVRKFFAESGDGYWVAVPVNRFRLDRLRALTEADLRKQLQNAQEELQEAKSAANNSDSR